MKTGDRIMIHPEDARREPLNATIERLTPSGFSMAIRLDDNQPMVLSRTENGHWVEVSTGRCFEIQEPKLAGGC